MKQKTCDEIMDGRVFDKRKKPELVFKNFQK